VVIPAGKAYETAGPGETLLNLMMERLRTRTRQAHERLETALALLDPPLSRTRFIRTLEGFRAFHAAWEPRVEALIGDPGLTGPRRRLALLDADLRALGASAGGGPDFDLGFLDGRAAAWGSLYVMEGSTLGGQVISRALQDARWRPAGGLAYFDPYGRRVGAMWKTFRTALEDAAASLDPEAVVQGAIATFATLEAGLAERRESAA
jgi:heme oxygenase (biliverdin-IX-beta and delta-forming)